MKKLHFITHIALGQTAQIVLRRHDLTIGTCRTDGEQIATLGSIEVDLLGEHVRRLTDGSDHIVSLRRFFAADVLDLMISLIEGRTNQVSKTSIDDGKFLDGPFFNI